MRSFTIHFGACDDGRVNSLPIQPESPGEALEPNWLPAPEGPFYVVMRLYGPTEEVLAGDWAPPPIEPQETGARD